MGKKYVWADDSFSTPCNQPKAEDLPLPFLLNRRNDADTGNGAKDSGVFGPLLESATRDYHIPCDGKSVVPKNALIIESALVADRSYPTGTGAMTLLGHCAGLRSWRCGGSRDK